MSEENKNPRPVNGGMAEGNNEAEHVNGQAFESDTQRIIHRHLKDKDDIITDDDIANVRVGSTPPQFDRATEARFEGKEAREEAEENLLEGTEPMEEDKNLDDEKMTPWDIIDPSKG